jgi:histidinol-phosphate phosphatase family protein
MIAVILAGGKGERLRPLTDHVPKPMVKVNGKPVLEQQVEVLRRYGIVKVFILTGYLGNVIEDYFGRGKNFGLEIECLQEDTPLGTAGALKLLKNRIQQDFLVVYGDVIFDLKISDLISFHREKNGVATLVAHQTDHPHDSDLLLTDDTEQVVEFWPKPHNSSRSNLSNAALYILSPEVFHYLPAVCPADIMHDLLPRLLANSEKVFAYQTCEYIKDMGTLDRIAVVENDLKSGKVARWSKEHKRPAVFIDRDGTLVEFVHLLHKVKDLRLLPQAARAVKLINQSDFVAIVVTNQPVVARNLCDVDTLQLIHQQMSVDLVREAGAYLDDIFFCPHHPDKGFPEENKALKIICNCRKPKTGMIDQAIKKYNIDPQLSWMIGDTDRDVQTGKNAGLKTIILQENIEKRKENIYHPDFLFNNLFDAIEFIINR